MTPVSAVFKLGLHVACRELMRVAETLGLASVLLAASFGWVRIIMRKQNKHRLLYFPDSVVNVKSRDVHECGERQSTDGRDHDGPYQQRCQRASQAARRFDPA